MARIVFDLDGTLIDSAPDIHGIANALLTADGYDPITLEQARDFIGNGAAVFVQRMRAARGIPDSRQERMLMDFVANYDRAVTLTRPYAGVEAALRTLRGQGHRLGICTNKPLRATKAVLDHLGLSPYFETVWGGDSLPVHKPDPSPLDAAFRKLGEGPEIYVGDSEVDAETAQRAMVPFLLFTEGYRKTSLSMIPHTASFGAFDGLPDLVSTLLAEAA
jgi:phosphoglycolate phosphatase